MIVTRSLFVEKLKAHFWILPGSVAVALVLLLLWAQTVQVSNIDSAWKVLLLYDASSEGARLILSSIATAVMTVVGVLFSITIVVLQQVSSQYAPRVIHNFIRSTPSQLVLGFYIGTFTYCLLLLRQIRDDGASAQVQVPQLAMSFAILLAIFCLCLLIYYVHHITHSIQSTQIIAQITKESLGSIRNIVEDRREYAPTKSISKRAFTHEVTLLVKERGYLQAIEWKSLKRKLGDHEWYVEVQRSPGSYLQKGTPLLRVYGRTDWSEKDHEKLLSRFAIGPSRTYAQDPEFGVRQLVDIGLRALSPGINDPSTALEALHGISAILLLYALEYPIQNRIQFEPNRTIQVPEITPERFVGLCFDQLLQFGKDHLPILSQISETLELTLHRTDNSDASEALMRRKQSVESHIDRITRSFSWMERQSA